MIFVDTYVQSSARITSEKKSVLVFKINNIFYLELMCNYTLLVSVIFKINVIKLFFQIT